ncbi:hypothetical protein D3C81_1502110 [compost metagenome]
MQRHRQRQAQFDLRAVGQVVDRPQVQLGLHGRLGETLDFKQAITHTLIAQGDAAAHRVHFDTQASHTLAVYRAMQHQKAMNFGGITVFTGNKRQARRLAIEVPVGMGGKAQRQQQCGQKTGQLEHDRSRETRPQPYPPAIMAASGSPRVGPAMRPGCAGPGLRP